MSIRFTHRRRFLQSALTYGLALSSPAVSMKSLGASSPLQWQELGSGLALIQGAGGNVLVLHGAEGSLLVDGGRAEHAEALLELIVAKTGAVPEVLINTHCHRDQVGCNRILGAAGKQIIAHENTRLWLGTEIISKWEDRVYQALPETARPNKTFFYDSHSLAFSGQEIEYGYLPQAHTDGDLYVYFPADNLLMAGDVVAVSAYPILDYATGGWLGGMVQSLESLLEKCDDNTRIVAGTGVVVGRDHLQAQLEMCRHVLERIAGNYYKGFTYQAFLAGGPSREYDERWGDPKVFLHTAYEGAWAHMNELGRYRRR